MIITFKCRHMWGRKSCRRIKISASGSQVLELQDCVGRLQTLNNELQNRLSLLGKSEQDAYDKEDKDVASGSPWKQVRSPKKVCCNQKLYLKLRRQSS